MQTKKGALCSFHDKRYLLEDGITLLAFGHRDIPAQVADVEDVGLGETILTHDEAVERRISTFVPREQNPRPPCIWEERRKKRLLDAKELLRADLGLADEEIEDDEDPKEDDGTHNTRPPNGFILDQTSVSRGRKCKHVTSDSD